MPVRARRTQEERSAATRALLLEATIDCLVELGYAATTTTSVCDRAGVSRGAQLHHYPTKAELVAAAMEHLFETREQEFRRAMSALPAGPRRASAAVDLLWSMVSGRSFYAWLELAVASRTDGELRRAMRRFSTSTTEKIEQAFKDLFQEPDAPSPLFALAPQIAFSVMHGLALHGLVQRDEEKTRSILAALKSLSSLVMPGGAR
jgi:AcrR family transcriptional regulator